jgi:hypothetical protein
MLGHWTLFRRTPLWFRLFLVALIVYAVIAQAIHINKNLHDNTLRPQHVHTRSTARK